MSPPLLIALQVCVFKSYQKVNTAYFFCGNFLFFIFYCFFNKIFSELWYHKCHSFFGHNEGEICNYHIDIICYVCCSMDRFEKIPFFSASFYFFLLPSIFLFFLLFFSSSFYFFLLPSIFSSINWRHIFSISTARRWDRKSVV